MIKLLLTKYHMMAFKVDPFHEIGEELGRVTTTPKTSVAYLMNALIIAELAVEECPHYHMFV